MLLLSLLTACLDAQDVCKGTAWYYDGEVDEEAVDASDVQDEDGDGFGHAEVPACEGASSDDDCDDTDATVNPAAEEHCGGGY